MELQKVAKVAVANGHTNGIKGAEISAQEVCEKLAITPHTLRHICDEYSELIPLVRHEGRTYLEPLAFSRLQLILLWRAKGMASEEIRERLIRGGTTTPDSQPKAAVQLAMAKALDAREAQEDTPAVRDDGKPDHAEQADTKRIMAEIEFLKDRLSQIERRRGEEKDRLTMALTRIQQELSQIKHEVSSLQTSRRAKKRKGFFQRLFG